MSAVKFQYVTNCTQSDGPSITAMVNAGRQISFRVFARFCDWQPLARQLGYHIGSGKGLLLRRDWHVKYYHSTYKGAECYYMDHSRIEHIFLRPPS
jgi:hypothetical protein